MFFKAKRNLKEFGIFSIISSKAHEIARTFYYRLRNVSNGLQKQELSMVWTAE